MSKSDFASQEDGTQIGRREGGRRFPATSPPSNIIKRFRRGDRGAVDELFSYYRSYVYHICLGILFDPEEAEDAMQETFIRAYQGFPKFRGHASLPTWLYRIAVNTSISLDTERRKRCWLPIEEIPFDLEEATWVISVEKMEQSQAVQTVLYSLPVLYQEVLVLRYCNDLSYREMAHALSTTTPCVKVRLYRARQAFRERFHELFGREAL